MKYFTFQHRFIEKIRRGVKVSTIRDKPKVKPGERFSLRYWADKPYRSKQVEIAQAICLDVLVVHIDLKRQVMAYRVDGRPIDASALVKQEGFASSDEMAMWFYLSKAMPYRGVLTKWELA